MKIAPYLLALVCCFAARAHAATPADKPTQALIEQIVDTVKPSLVRIHVVEAVPNGGKETKNEAFGSGVIISPDGYVVTNHHVAGMAKWLSCTLSDKQQVDAKLIGSDALSDIAVIQLAPSAAGAYPAARWGDSSKLRVGDPVLAMGSPLAFSQSVTAGIISNTELIIPQAIAGSFTLNGEDVGSIVRWIGHDAQIHPGNSGGPLINQEGEVIGINEISFGLSGAIPGNLAREISSEIIAKGKIVRAYTGMDLQPRLRRDSRPSGVLVSGVLRGSPAAQAGVKPGDLLLSAGDATLDAKFLEQLPLVNLQLTRLPVDRKVPLKLQRGDQEVAVDLQPRLRNLAEAPSSELKGWGMTCSDITQRMAEENRFPDTDGVLVTGLATGAPAAEAEPPLEEGDVILSIGAKPTSTLARLREISAAIPHKPDGVPVLVEVRRKTARVLCVVRVNKANAEDTSVEVAKAWLPIDTQVVTKQLAEALHLPSSTEGVRVTRVEANSVAETAGLKVGDIITKLDGQAVEASQPEDTDVFSTMVRQYKIGAAAKVTVLRHGKPTTLKVHLPRAPQEERELATYADDSFGMTLRSVTYMDRMKKTAAPGENGALITTVDPGSWAALAGLAVGDVLHSIDGVGVRDLSEAKSILQSMKLERPKQALFFVGRGVHTLFVEAQTDWSLPATAPVKPLNVG